MICRACHSLELSGRPDGLVVRSDQKGKAVGHTEDVDVIVAAVHVLGWLTKRGGREEDTAKEAERVTEKQEPQLEASFWCPVHTK